MAEDLELSVRLKADGSGLVGEVRVSKEALEKLGKSGAAAERGMGRLGRGADFAQRQLGQLRNHANRVGRALTSLRGIAAGLGIGFLAKSFINAASTAEQFRVRLNVLLQSVSEGNRLFAEMAQFAATAPFEKQHIMAAATQLAGVMRGGVDEIVQWIPLIADLAAAAGLGIQETTDQVARMLSSGALSADLFQQRGTLAMMGFTAGVSVSAEETKRRLMEAWQSTTSQFRGATGQLAKTWNGSMSMLADKWEEFRLQIMDAGLFDFLKAVVSTFDEDLGAALQGNQDMAKRWSDATINGIENVVKAIGVMADGWRGIEAIWKLLEISFTAWKLTILEGLGSITAKAAEFQAMFEDKVPAALRKVLEVTPQFGPLLAAMRGLSNLDSSAIQLWGQDTRAELDGLKRELEDLLTRQLPSEQLAAKLEQVREKYAELREAAARAATATDKFTGSTKASTAANEKETEALQKRLDALADSLQSEIEAERRRHKESIALLDQAEAAKLASILSFAELRARATREHARRLGEIDSARVQKQIDLEDARIARFEAGIKDSTDTAGEAARELGLTFESAFENAVVRGEGLRSVLHGIAQDIQRIILRKTVTEPLGGFLRGAIAGLFSGDELGFDAIGTDVGFQMHRGGIAGEATTRRTVHPAVFAGAPRMHRGGLAGDEVPAILRRGEEVLVRSDPRHRANAGGASITVINNIDARGADAGVDAKIRAAMKETSDITIQRIREEKRAGGPLSRM